MRRGGRGAGCGSGRDLIRLPSSLLALWCRCDGVCVCVWLGWCGTVCNNGVIIVQKSGNMNISHVPQGCKHGLG